MKTTTSSIIQQIASKLLSDGLTYLTYTRDEANEILSNTIMPTKLKELLSKYEPDVLKIMEGN